jgi:16S rRNA (cytosine1402-N4)-methyltransferase
MKSIFSAEPHVPIMVKEVLEGLSGAHLEVFFDGTLGAGGHARAILEAHPEIKRYIGCDKDPEALEIAEQNLAPWGSKVEFVQGDFGRIDEYLAALKLKSVDGFFLISECLLCN